eukprot:TRINITY_DN7462_c0_g1_i2.p1 TRINITY_DN7462_c0_g1~~TRINITY_DN7462_c0_g1_i2.p1  ORF type:complete len:481 (-),score=119.70 TRINITY_DN7462_c0_g1_i2:238-1680(-)
MFEAFRKIVNQLQRQISKFRKRNDELEQLLGDLGGVEEGLQEVYGQMDGDIAATATLLEDLERFGKMQTVAAVVNQFYAADYDGSGHISGREAELLLPQLTLLWSLVPGYDRSQVERHVSQHGLTLQTLSGILDALVKEDEQACRSALDQLCVDREATEPATKTLASDGDHALAPPATIDLDGATSEAGMRTCDEEVLWSMRRCICEDGVHAMAPSKLEETSEGSAPEEEALVPLFSFPTPACKLGPFTTGNRTSVWGYWHLTALCCVPVSAAMTLLVILGLEIGNIVVAVIGFCLTVGLCGTGKLIEVLRVLRRQIKELKVENERLAKSVENLRDKVGKLQKLQHGFEKLQQLCSGNAAKAKDLIAKSNTKVKMEAMAVVTHLFKQADRDHNFKVEGDELNQLLSSLEAVFRSLPGFSMQALQDEIGPDGLDMKHITRLVDHLACFETLKADAVPDKPPPEPPAESPAEPPAVPTEEES